MQDLEPGRRTLQGVEYSHRLWKWLNRHQFTEDPFAVWEADRERSVLPSLFVDRPYAVRLVGDPARPQSGFLLAGRGAGKTATREIVAHECDFGRIRRRALPIRYTDFTAVLDQVGGNPDRVTLREHANAIVRAGLRVLANDVPATYFSPLDEARRSLLLSLAAEFADPLSSLELSQRAPAPAVEISWQHFSPVELLDIFASLVTHLGAADGRRYESIYVLVDRVDETAAGAAGALALLKPLVVEGALLGIPRVAFKFFLPRDIGEKLLVSAEVRRDRLIVETITWDDASLVRMVEMRLSHYSNGNIERLTQLCTAAAASGLPRLWRTCNDSPRDLLRLCATMLRFHVERTDDPFLEPRDISRALVEFEQQQEAERAQPLIAARQAEAARAGHPPTSGLYLDEGDHVWIDGQQLETPLSDLEYRLLKVLYQASPAIVSQEDLIAAVWHVMETGPDDKAYATDEQNVRKLIARVRDRLEPGASGSWRFVRNARGRGYWLSVS